MKIIVFDLGGTLMEFEGMPLSWVDYYKTGFENLAESIGKSISARDIELSVNIMKSYNPRINYREKEYSAELIFENCLKHWSTDINIGSAIEEFFDGMDLKTVLYCDTVEMLKYLKYAGFKICALTDIPNGMPDCYFKNKIKELLNYIDFYVSSQSCGYRKPNACGMKLIADEFNADLSDLIFVGDEEKDKLLAERIKCRFCFIDRKGINKNADINNLYELKELIISKH